jgi:hypothetical protein
MLQTIEAVLNPDGKIHLLETVKLTSPQKVLVIILSEQPVLQNTPADFKTALLAMPNVGKDTDFEREQDYGRNIEILVGH